MWMKVTGALLVMVSCTGLGTETARQLKERRKLLETLKRMISQLKGEILYSNLPLPAAFLRAGQRNAGAAAALFLSIAKRMEETEGESFDEVWKLETELFFKSCPLDTAEMEGLRAFGSCLGYLDRDMQERTIDFYMEELEQGIQVLRKAEPEKCRLFRGLGILGGLFLTVIFL